MKIFIAGLLIFLVGCSRAPIVPTPVEATAIHNVFRVSDRIYSGSSPDGEGGFAELERLGIKTIVSVDGATPDVEMAQRHGMKYVHLPIGYDGVPNDRVRELGKVARDFASPIYVHCHHGKHRGPAAVVAMQMCVDPDWNINQAEEWLKSAGTDPRYKGLIGLPKSMACPSKQELDAMPSEFPSIHRVDDLTTMMVKLDEHWDALKNNHPDIDPPHEALQLAETYRELSRLESVLAKGDEFGKLLHDAESAAIELEMVLRMKPVDAEVVKKAFARSQSMCSRCHAAWRDR